MNQTTKTATANTAADPQARTGLMHEIRNLMRLWPYLRPSRWALLTAALLIPVIAALQTAPPLLLQRAVDLGIIAGQWGVLAGYGAAFAAVVTCEYLARALQSITSSYAVHRMILLQRQDLVRHVLRLPPAYHDQTLSGTLVTRATGDYDNLSESLNMGVLTSLVDLAVLAGCVVGMFLLEWRLALGTLVILPVVGMTVRWFSRALKTAMLKARAKIAAVNAFAQECLYGLPTIRTLHAEAAAADRHDRLCREFRDAQMGGVVLDALMFAILDGVAAVTTGLVLWLATGADVASAISAGVLVAFVQYVQQFFEPLKQLGNKMAMLQGAFASLERINAVLGRKERIEGEEPVSTVSGAVSFNEVSHRYGDSGAHSLAGVSFDLPAGQTLALVGPTGSGKSTVIKLLAKLYDGYAGTIRLDGRDLRRLDPWALRRRLAIVPQDVALFDGTVAENIALFDPAVTPEAVRHAAAVVGANRFISRLPGGFDAPIRERGANLSAGQRQLLVFARALARDPGLIILDEATSTVDPESEALVQAAIASLLHGRTVIVIAHRLSTIRRCDQILVLDRGRITERGGHADLLALGGTYARMHGAMAGGV